MEKGGDGDVTEIVGIIVGGVLALVFGIPTLVHQLRTIKRGTKQLPSESEIRVYILQILQTELPNPIVQSEIPYNCSPIARGELLDQVVDDHNSKTRDDNYDEKTRKPFEKRFEEALASLLEPKKCEALIEETENGLLLTSFGQNICLRADIYYKDDVPTVAVYGRWLDKHMAIGNTKSETITTSEKQQQTRKYIKDMRPTERKNLILEVLKQGSGNQMDIELRMKNQHGQQRMGTKTRSKIKGNLNSLVKGNKIEKDNDGVYHIVDNKPTTSDKNSPSSTEVRQQIDRKSGPQNPLQQTNLDEKHKPTTRTQPPLSNNPQTRTSRHSLPTNAWSNRRFHQLSDAQKSGIVLKIVTEKEGAYEDVVSGVIAELNQKRMTSQYKEEIRFILLRLEADGVIEESGRIYRKV